jgi:hypothetical protein
MDLTAAEPVITMGSQIKHVKTDPLNVTTNAIVKLKTSSVTSADNTIFIIATFFI